MRRLLPRTFFPDHARNRMCFEGDLAHARNAFLAGRSNNLDILLGNRFQWMDPYIRGEKTVVEIGSGAGLSRFYLGNKKIILSEIAPYPWVDMCLDAMQLPFGPASLDAVICVNVIHHFPHPMRFLQAVEECLVPGGHLLLFEPNPSLLLLLVLRLMRHEGWSFDCDAFDADAPVSNPADPWAGNNAVSELLFGDRALLGRHVSGLRIVEDRFCECLTFLLSGGVTAKTMTIPLPIPVLRAIARLDTVLCKLAPKIFAMGRAIALRKQNT